MKYSPWPEVFKLRLYVAWNVVEAEEEAADGAGVGGLGGWGWGWTEGVIKSLPVL